MPGACRPRRWTRGANVSHPKFRTLAHGLKTLRLQAKVVDAQRNSAASKPSTLAHGVEILRLQAKALDAGRMAAFAQRLAGAAQFLDAPSALGLLAVLDRMLRCAPAQGLTLGWTV